MFTLVNFLPSCFETLVIDPEVCGQVQGHDVAGASVRAAWFRISTQRLNFTIIWMILSITQIIGNC